MTQHVNGHSFEHDAIDGAVIHKCTNSDCSVVASGVNWSKVRSYAEKNACPARNPSWTTLIDTSRF